MQDKVYSWRNYFNRQLCQTVAHDSLRWSEEVQVPVQEHEKVKVFNKIF